MWLPPDSVATLSAADREEPPTTSLTKVDAAENSSRSQGAPTTAGQANADIRADAQVWADAGCSVIPVKADGTKEPAIKWKPFQTRPSTSAELDRMLPAGTDCGIGIVCGAVSGGLEMFEFEGRAVAEGISVKFATAMRDHGLGELWDRLTAGLVQHSPSGGVHWIFRVDGGPVRGNTKLASRPATAAELAADPKTKLPVLIETRGEGGQFVAAPSGGTVHPSGRAWTLANGTPGTIRTITADECDQLHALATMFDRSPVKPEPVEKSATVRAAGGTRPGDAFNQRADWRDILEPHGWTRLYPMGSGFAWRRPGKNGGSSATTGQSDDGADRLYVFSTSTEFEAEVPYSKFAAHTLLNHGGDYRAAAQELKRRGFGADRLPVGQQGQTGSVTDVTDVTAPMAEGPTAVPVDGATDVTDVTAAMGEGPTAVPVDGADVLDAVERFARRFVVYPDDHAAVAHTLWIGHAHLMDRWDSTARLAFLSPEPGSGKSRALEVTAPLVPRPILAVNATPAYLFRKVADQAGRPTILHDEIDTVFGPKAKDNEDTRGMINAGHRKDAKAGRCVVRGKVVETEELDAYCAVALAGLDDLPDTIMTRSIVIRMRRRRPDEPVEPWRLRQNEGEAKALAARLATWTSQVPAGIDWPEMPDGVQDRDADVWEALIVVADLAGGHWPDRARLAAVEFVKAAKVSPPSLSVMLLRDLRTVFQGSDLHKDPTNENLGTQEILTALNGMDESPWGDLHGRPLDARGLSRRLRKYGVRPKTVRVAGQQVPAKGYSGADLADPWTRYLTEPEPLGPPTKGSVTSVTAVAAEPEPATAPTGAPPMVPTTPSTTGPTERAEVCPACTNPPNPNHPHGLCGNDDRHHQDAARHYGCAVA